MGIRIVTPPALEPITLAEAKAHLRLEETRDDVFVQTLITAARQYIEKMCWRGLLPQVWEQELPSFRGADKLELPRSYGPGGGDGLAGFSPGGYGILAGFNGTRFQPYIELSGGHLADTPAISVVYLDTAGATQTLAAGAYVVQGLGNDNMCGRLWLNVNGGYSWPNTLDRFDAVKVTYTVGWTQLKLPRPIVQAMLLLISQMYEYRTPEITGTIATKLEWTIDVLTSPYRLLRL